MALRIFVVILLLFLAACCFSKAYHQDGKWHCRECLQTFGTQKRAANHECRED